MRTRGGGPAVLAELTSINGKARRARDVNAGTLEDFGGGKIRTLSYPR